MCWGVGGGSVLVPHHPRLPVTLPLGNFATLSYIKNFHCPYLYTKTGPTKTCWSARTASGVIELLLKAAGTQGAQGTQT